MSTYDKSNSRSELQSKIIKILKKQEKMRFTELRNELNISKPVLSYHLNILSNEKTIEFEKKGREKFYQLNPNMPSILERKIDIFSSEIFEMLSSVDENNKNVETIFEEISHKITAAWFFSIFKSIHLGEDWSGSVDFKEHTRDIMHRITELVDESEKTELHDIIASQDRINFERIKIIINQDKKMKNNLEKIFTKICNRYKDEFKQLDMISNTIIKS